jgi:hypothetical protein
MSTQNNTSVSISGGTITGTYGLNTTGSSAKVASGDWLIEFVGSTLYFRYGPQLTAVAKLDGSGNFSVKGDITAFATGF